MLRAPRACYFAKYSTIRCHWIQFIPEATPYFTRTVYMWYFIALRVLSLPELACRRQHWRVKHKYCLELIKTQLMRGARARARAHTHTRNTLLPPHRLNSMISAQSAAVPVDSVMIVTLTVTV